MIGLGLNMFKHW